MKEKVLGVLIVLIVVLISLSISLENVGSHTNKYVMVLDLHYEHGEIILNNMDIKKGTAPDYRVEPDEGYTFNLLSRSGKIIDSFKFLPPTKINIDQIDPVTGEFIGEEIIRNVFDFTLRIPYIRGSDGFEIKNTENLVVFSGNLDKNVISQFHKIAVPEDKCKKLIYNGDPEQRLDVVFVSDNFTALIEVSNLIPDNYETAYLDEWDEYYIDRDYTIANIPADYEDLLWIKTSNDDKTIEQKDWLNFNIDMNTIVYVGIDTREGLPPWIESEHWREINDYILVEANNGPVEHWLYYKMFPEGYVGIDGNAGFGNMYIVLLKPKNPLEGFEEVLWRHIDPSDEYEGLLSREPLQSNQHKFNFYYINEDGRYYCEQPGTCQEQLIREEIASHCPYDEIIVLIDGPHHYNAWAHLGNHFAVSYTGRFGSVGNEPAVTSHEFGHSWGFLADEYPIRYPWSDTWLVNCDVADTEEACPDWCEGPPIPPEPDPNGCWEYETQEDCEWDFYNGCEWLDSPHPYFGYQCIYWEQNYLDIGTSCMEGTGCYFNCHGTNGWRSVQYSLMYTGMGEDIEFGPVSEAWLESLLDEYPDVITKTFKTATRM